MGGAGVEPDVQRVADLVVLGGLVAEQLGGVQLEPGLDALLLDALGHGLHQLGSTRVQLAAFLVQEERNGHAPVALARDAPIRPPGDHAVQARLAPGRDEGGLLDAGDGTLAQGAALGRLLVHADEPLGGGAVDQRGLVAPAVHVAVVDLLVGQQAADLGQLVDDRRVGLPDELATEERQRLGVHAVALHRIEDVVVVHAVALARVEVVLAVGRGRMDDAGTGVQGHIVGQVDRGETLVEGVTEANLLQCLALRPGDHLALQAVAGKAGLHQLLGQQQQLVAGVDQGVLELRVDVQRLVGRDGPGRGGPDHHIGGLGQARETEGRRQLVGILYGEADVDGRRLLVGILDFRLGQRRATVEAPVDRLQALEHEALLDHFGQGADLTGLVGERHGLVGVVPVAQDAEADEVGLLPFDLLGGIGAAQLTGLVGRQVLAVGGFHLVLDWQTMTVPARHVGRVIARQGLGAGDDVLENLVDRVADVNAAVGIGRAIVQDELRPALAKLPQLLIQADVVPTLQGLRLALRQAGLHRELGIRQI